LLHELARVFARRNLSCERRIAMKRLFTIAVLGLFGGAMVIGCEASGSIGDDDPDVRSSRTEVKRDDDSYSKKTTTKYEDGERTTKTEVKRD
jgi:hypothetical protein